ncbi:MAG: hypothetical protein KTR33_14285 [Gammaproteobacteria bacterium]|nr:hypothetical protein [Gammaproteobacteria bacterium]
MQCASRLVWTRLRNLRWAFNGLLTVTLLSTIQMQVSPVSANESADREQGFNLTQSDDLLTLEAKGASLVEIIDRLQELTEIPISFSEPFDRTIELEIRDVDVETLIGKLASNNLITKLDYQSYIKISEILLMPDGKEGGNNLAALPSGEPAEAIVVGADQPATEQPAGQQVITENPTPETTEQTGDNGGIKVEDTNSQ